MLFRFEKRSISLSILVTPASSDGNYRNNGNDDYSSAVVM